jgi:2-polyprenyl-3-methyl-5-hydroxy-6-metoxy-1,4-benzoquinol methylase
MSIKNSHIDLVKTHFDINAQMWKDLYYNFNKSNEIVLSNRKNISVAFLCKYLKHNSKILDAGCGAGIVAMDIVQKGFFVHGIDISPKMIEICNQTFSQKEIDTCKYLFSVGNLVDIDFPDNFFDGIIALGFLEYQKDEHEILKRFRKIIRPGGVLICSGPTKIRLSNYFRLRAKKVSKSISINKYSLSRFKMLMKHSGFNLIDYKRHGYSNFMNLNRFFGSKGDILLYRIFTKLSTFLPIQRWANDIIVVAVKQ